MERWTRTQGVGRVTDYKEIPMHKVYGCAKRGCDAVNPAYLSFGTREGKGYCLHHIPWRSRLRLWKQDKA